MVARGSSDMTRHRLPLLLAPALLIVAGPVHAAPASLVPAYDLDAYEVDGQPGHLRVEMSSVVIETGFLFGVVIETGFFEPGEAEATFARIGANGAPDMIVRGYPIASGEDYVELIDAEVVEPGPVTMKGHLVAVQLTAFASDRIADETPTFLMVVGKTTAGPFAEVVSYGLGGTGFLEIDGLYAAHDDAPVHAVGKAFDEPILFIQQPDRAAVQMAIDEMADGVIEGGTPDEVAEQWGAFGAFDQFQDSGLQMWAGLGPLLPEVDDEVIILNPSVPEDFEATPLVPAFVGKDRIADPLVTALGVWGTNAVALDDDPQLQAWMVFASEQLLGLDAEALGGDLVELDGIEVVGLGPILGRAL
mgnify:CR=1 FL=1